MFLLRRLVPFISAGKEDKREEGSSKETSKERLKQKLALADSLESRISLWIRELDYGSSSSSLESTNSIVRAGASDSSPEDAYDQYSVEEVSEVEVEEPDDAIGSHDEKPSARSTLIEETAFATPSWSQLLDNFSSINRRYQSDGIVDNTSERVHCSVQDHADSTTVADQTEDLGRLFNSALPSSSNNHSIGVQVLDVATTPLENPNEDYSAHQGADSSSTYSSDDEETPTLGSILGSIVNDERRDSDCETSDAGSSVESIDDSDEQPEEEDATMPGSGCWNLEVAARSSREQQKPRARKHYKYDKETGLLIELVEEGRRHKRYFIDDSDSELNSYILPQHKKHKATRDWHHDYI